MFDAVTSEQRHRLRAWLFNKSPQESTPVNGRAVA
jgi:hypothetical protein